MINVLKNLETIVVKYLWLVILDVMFVAYIIINEGSIVLGDRNNHKPVIHLMQVLYFLLFLTFFCWGPTVSDHLSATKAVLKRMRQTRQLLIFGALFGANLFIVNKFSLTHRFQSFDNRHYAHYFHEYVISTAWKYAFVPVYTYLMFHIYELLKAQSTFAASGQHQLLIFAIMIGASATLIPAHLFEPRYFIIAWTMMALEWSMKKIEDPT